MCTRVASERFAWMRWVDRFSIVLASVGAFAAALMTVDIVFDVIGRALFNQPLPGTLDLTQYAWMPTVVSLGLGYALLRGDHIRVNMLTGPTGPRTQRIIEIVSMLFLLTFVGLLMWSGIEKTVVATGLGERATGTAWLAIWPFRWVVAVGLLGLFLQAAAQLVRAVTVKVFIPLDDDDESEAAAALASEEAALNSFQFETGTGEDPRVGRKEGAIR
ncbi:TRAP transporter small permease [Salinibacterium sp. ZJ454]|uniref:TRAP transporter small permease subunit n=1 Tax=Salinibacterium sp. ZJ454 TaxID=2708339 RepID=UPI0014212E07|nr:TRAP transporter small permease [Salinibacterium sp. ZJ454]